MRCRISSINSRLKRAFQCVRGNCHEFPASCYALHQTANARIPLKKKIDQKNTKRHQIHAAFRLSRAGQGNPVSPAFSFWLQSLQGCAIGWHRRLVPSARMDGCMYIEQARWPQRPRPPPAQKELEVNEPLMPVRKKLEQRLQLVVPLI